MQVPNSLTSADARWQAHAGCAATGAASFYSPTTPSSRAQAKAVCGTCSAAEPCLWAALALEQVVGYRYGIWGGTTPHRRAQIAATLPPVDLTPWYLQVATTWSPPVVPVRSGRRVAA